MITERRPENSMSVADILSSIRTKEYQIDGDFKGKDILSTEQFTRDDILQVMETAARIELSKEGGSYPECENLLKHKRVAVCFYQPSTRTYMSFMAAAQNMGAYVIGVPGMMQYSSAVKGESLQDTVRTIEAHGTDAIVMRHEADDFVIHAAEAADIPIINAGAGKFEHPTQAMLDLYTITQNSPIPLDAMSVTFVGDLKYGRTVHSLAKVLTVMGVPSMNFISPETTCLPTNLASYLEEKGVVVNQQVVHEPGEIGQLITHTDVIYDTRVQKEWFTSDQDYVDACRAIQITPEVMSNAPEHSILLHPLPRVDEITTDVDLDPRAKYFAQVASGVPVRMALLALVMGADTSRLAR